MKTRIFKKGIIRDQGPVVSPIYYRSPTILLVPILKLGLPPPAERGIL